MSPLGAARRKRFDDSLSMLRALSLPPHAIEHYRRLARGTGRLPHQIATAALGLDATGAGAAGGDPARGQVQTGDAIANARRRTLILGLALAAASFLVAWVLAGRDAFDDLASPVAIASFLVGLASLWWFPRTAGVVQIGIAAFTVAYVAAKVTALLFAPADVSRFALRAAVFVPWGPVIVTMAWAVFGAGARLYAVIGAYYAALLLPGGWWLATRVATSRGPALAVGGSEALASGVITVMLVLMIRLESQRAAADARSRILAEIAWVDLVTELPNRRALEDGLAREWSRRARTGAPLALVMFDLDRFKPINDGQGHHVGDRLLAAVGARVRAVLRPSDVFGRWGGDEFLVVLPDTTLAQAVNLAERMRAVISTEVARDRGGGVTASFGVAACGDGEAPDNAIARADQALYAAKARGRDRVEAAG